MHVCMHQPRVSSLGPRRGPRARALVRAHVRRELGCYALLKDAIATAHARSAIHGSQPVVMDIGANHGVRNKAC